MRDPARIARILGKIQQVWEKSPDQRFGQFVFNMQHDMRVAGLPVHVAREGMLRGFDAFHVEDGSVEAFLDNLLKD